MISSNLFMFVYSNVSKNAPWTVISMNATELSTLMHVNGIGKYNIHIYIYIYDKFYNFTSYENIAVSKCRLYTYTKKFMLKRTWLFVV